MHRISLALSLAICLCTAAVVRPAWGFPPTPQVTIRELIPLATWQKQFKITEGKDRGKLVPLSFRHEPGHDQRFKLLFGDYAGVLMRSDSGGGLIMERLDLLKSRSYIVYDPVLPILPREFTAAVSPRRQAGFKMYDLPTGRLKRAGRVTHRVKQISYSQFDTPAGLVDGYTIEIEHAMEMPFAQLDLTLRLGCRLDEGPVYGSGQYTLKKLGLFSETKTATAALAKIEKIPGTNFPKPSSIDR
jgi:hypothetical protein